MIALACDHGGFAMKEAIRLHLEELGLAYEDFGCYSDSSVDYPIYGAKAARAVGSGQCERGIVVCTTGIGISISANKIHGVRCALCSEPYSAEMTRRHNDANMLALGGAFIGTMAALRIVDVFLSTEFEGGRHQRRVDQIMALEDNT